MPQQELTTFYFLKQIGIICILEKLKIGQIIPGGWIPPAVWLTPDLWPQLLQIEGHRLPFIPVWQNICRYLESGALEQTTASGERM